MAGKRPFISLTTDCGASSTATCAGVIYTLAPDANVLTLTHEITQGHLIEAAMLLRRSLPYFPVGVHIAIAGTEIQAVAIETGRGDVLIGPDNGLLLPACEQLGGIARAHRLEEAPGRPAGPLSPAPGSGFPGRDVFAPAAAWIALGGDLSELGARVHTLAELGIPAPRIGDGEISVPVLYADESGGLILGGETSDVHTALGDLVPGVVIEATWLDTTGETRRLRLPYGIAVTDVPPGSPVLYADASGWIGVAAVEGTAADRLGLGPLDVITLRKAKASISG